MSRPNKRPEESKPGGHRVKTDWGGREEKSDKMPRKMRSDEDTSLEKKFGVDILQQGEERTGYLFNMKPSTIYSEEDNEHVSCLLLYFIDRSGRSFRASFPFTPYLLVDVLPSFGAHNLDSLGNLLATKYEAQGAISSLIKKDDLELADHLSGKKHVFIKLTFPNADCLSEAKRGLNSVVKANLTRIRGGVILDEDEELTAEVVGSDPLDYLCGLFEHDVALTNRACIDEDIKAGRWYNVKKRSLLEMDLVYLPEMLVKPDLRVFAFDIETSKAPLKFPDAQYDPVLMISAMCDGAGFLLVNREEVSADVEDFEYTPKPEYEGLFSCINCESEKAMFSRFFELLVQTGPHIITTFNGDSFDLPYLIKRSELLGLSMYKEVGLGYVSQGQVDEFVTGKWMLHLDCFAWVQRDSYLPQGSQGLKAVTKAKLKYNPVELDPELITPYAREKPQELCTYSVSDAVATFYLYKKYIHDFVFALASIIPANPDDVLRKGSGTLCELLLMAQAFQARVVFPNKHVEERLSYHNGRLVENSTYEGGRVECLRTGVFRADFPEKFKIDGIAVDQLRRDLEGTLEFFLTKEEKLSGKDVVENWDEVYSAIDAALAALIVDKSTEYTPLIYHLDVAAMYPNIILSNRLQPSALVSSEDCAKCAFGADAEGNNCQRKMAWKWRGDLFMATKADVKQVQRELSAPNHKYATKGSKWGNPDPKKLSNEPAKKVAWKELQEKEQFDLLLKNVRDLSLRMYKRVKSSVYEEKLDTVCQRENPFYINTIRAFRDRRYEFKDLVKTWNKHRENAEIKNDLVALTEAKDRVLLFDSLQLAHKCILNSFYGYVMRKGARWHNMKMAGIVTFTGSNLIREAREFVERMGLPLELDTDGIWCMLPGSFPDKFKFKLKNGKQVSFSYPCSVLNERVHKKYTNHQYQNQDPKTGEWTTSSENSIFFEIDGPYKAMMLPASTEEDKMLKKRYAVYNHDGSIAELKGFEIKRRGELKLIQVFQEEIFPLYLAGHNREGVYSAVGSVANRWLAALDAKGRSLSDEEVLYLISEKKSMSKSVEESGELKSASITTARRVAEFLGDGILKERGISIHLVIANRPYDAKPTDRAIPVAIFSAAESVKKNFLKKWLGDPFMTDFDMRSVIDWSYYRGRLGAAIHKVVVIPALNQRIPNPCPTLDPPDWMKKRVAEWSDKFQQSSLKGMFSKMGVVAVNRVLHVSDHKPQVATQAVSQPITTPQVSSADIEDDFGWGQEISAPKLAPTPPISPTALPTMERVGLLVWLGEAKKTWKLQRSVVKEEIRLAARRGLKPPTAKFFSDLSLVSGGWGSEFINRRLAVVKWHVISIEKGSEARAPNIWIAVESGTEKGILQTHRIFFDLRKRIYLVGEPGGHGDDELLKNFKERKVVQIGGKSGSLILPRNQTVPSGSSLYEIDLTEAEFQVAISSLNSAEEEMRGRLFESQNPLEFALPVRVGAVVSVKEVGKLGDEFYRSLRMNSLDSVGECRERYLPGVGGELNGPLPTAFVHVARARSGGRVFAAIFDARTWKFLIFFSGVPAVARPSSTAIERWLFDSLNIPETELKFECSFFDSAGLLFKALNTALVSLVRAVPGYCILLASENGKLADLRVSLPVLDSHPTVSAPFSEKDLEFPALEWPRWAVQRWGARVSRVREWWVARLGLSRVTRVPVGNLPVLRDTQAALDIMFARRLRTEGCILWASETETADFGDSGINKLDEIEASEKLLGNGRKTEGLPAISGGVMSASTNINGVNNPGIYRSLCISISLNATLCSAALVKAKAISEIEGGELTVFSDSLGKGQLGLKTFSALINMLTEVVGRGRMAAQALRRLEEEILKFPNEPSFQQKQSECEAEILACSRVRESLYSWLSDRRSRLYDPLLLDKATDYMGKLLRILLNELKKLGCHIIHASAHRVVIATNKTSASDLRPFWSTLRSTLSNHAVLSELELQDNQLSSVQFGLSWLDEANWAGIPVGGEDVTHWRAETSWKLAEFLPPAVRQAFYLYSGEFLVKGMRAIHDCRNKEGLSNSQTLDRIPHIIKTVVVPGIRKRLYDFVIDVEAKRQEDLILLNAEREELVKLQKRQNGDMMIDDEDSMDDDSIVDSDQDDSEEGKLVRLKERIKDLTDKWAFPAPPGAHSGASLIPLNPAVEFVKYLCEVLLLERSDQAIQGSLEALRSDLLWILKVKPFSPESAFVSPRIQVPGCLLPDVFCDKCTQVTSIDIVTHPHRAPGVWICGTCGKDFDREGIEARLVDVVEKVVSAWQSQQLVCERCKRAKYTKCGRFCECSGRFITKFDRATAVDTLHCLRSVAIPHNLAWLNEVVQRYCNMLGLGTPTGINNSIRGA